MEQMVDQLAQAGVLRIAPRKRSCWYLATRAVISRTAALIVLVLSSPLMAAIALAIRLDSKGPVVFRQVGVGKNGRRFMMYKFRTMCNGAHDMLDDVRHLNEEPTQLIIRIKDDPRVTRLGRFLRATSLDELPQLVNILLGQMAIVGPRPPSPEEVEQYDEYQIQRLRTTPGLTGLWQVSGRKDLPFDDMVRLDIEYAEKQSLLFDLWIVAKTVPAVLRAEGAR